MKSWLQDNETYATHNEEKFFVAEKFIRTLKYKIYKYMTSVTKKLYIDKSEDKVNKYNNTYDSTNKMKPLIENQAHILTLIKNNKTDSKLKVGDHVRISKYKNVFAEAHTSNWSDDFVIKKVTNAVDLYYQVSQQRRNCWSFLQKGIANKKVFRTQKINKSKGQKLHVKWESYKRL